MPLPCDKLRRFMMPRATTGNGKGATQARPPDILLCHPQKLKDRPMLTTG